MSRGVFVTDEQVRLTGSPNVARFLAQALYWSNIEMVIQRQGWFYKSRDEWKDEAWLSRYQQEKARHVLKDMGLLTERHERRQNGIRLWFWLDQVKLNVLLNNLADSSITPETEDNSVELYDSSLTERSESILSDCSVNCIETTESSSIEESKTIVLKTPLKAKFSTIVSDNNKEDSIEYSDNYCEDESSNEDADAPSLPKLTDRTVNIHYSTELDTYKACHPFIYQFMKTRILSCNAWAKQALSYFQQNGFDAVIEDALVLFIDQWGQSIVNWYQKNASLSISPLSCDDVSLADIVSERIGDE